MRVKVRIPAMLTAIGIVAGGAVAAAGIAHAAQEPGGGVTHPSGTPYRYNGSPSPSLTANNAVPAPILASKAEVLARYPVPQGGVLISANLETMAEHRRADDHPKFQDAPGGQDRMVWVIKTDFSNGLQSTDGFWKRAVTTATIDAETSRILEVGVTGQYDGPGLHR